MPARGVAQRERAGVDRRSAAVGVGAAEGQCATAEGQSDVPGSTIGQRSGESRGRGLINRQRARARSGAAVSDRAARATQTGDDDRIRIEVQRAAGHAEAARAQHRGVAQRERAGVRASFRRWCWRC